MWGRGKRCLGLIEHYFMTEYCGGMVGYCGVLWGLVCVNESEKHRSLRCRNRCHVPCWYTYGYEHG